MEEYDFLIVGAGLAGCVLAERLASLGRKLLVVEKRGHIAGNCYDYVDDAGVLVHKYGPHYFRTNSVNVREYLSKFTEWLPQRYVVKASINGELYDLPINRNSLNKFFKADLKTDEETKAFLGKIRDTAIINPKNAEEQVLMLAGKELYNAFFKNYTKKQWGIEARELDASVTARIPIRFNDNPAYFDDSFQAMPKEGYTKMFEGMLVGENITLMLGTEYEKIRARVKFRKLIYTGQIDTFFGCKYGKLRYRSLKFVHESHTGREYFQAYSQINYPNEEEYTRIVEIKHATKQKCPNTTIVYEYPIWDGEPYYPVPNEKEREVYQKYSQEARKLNDVYFIGRLATYRYLNMDQIVKEALELFEAIKDE